jgi:NAD(P)H-dependent flavin oxidoreductase YrpB (nitropropane dioxygenase family)
MGTRFVASQESRAHPEYKRLLIEQTETEMTLCFDIGWPTAKQRVLPNETLAKWKSAGEPSSPDRPGEGDVVAWSGRQPIYRYEDTAAQAGMEGRIEEMCLYAGTSVAFIDDLPTAAELVARLAP